MNLFITGYVTTKPMLAAPSNTLYLSINIARQILKATKCHLPVKLQENKEAQAKLTSKEDEGVKH